MFTADGRYTPPDQPSLQQLSGEQQVVVTALWALADAIGPEFIRGGWVPPRYTEALFGIAKTTRKYARTPFDRQRLGTGLPKQRKPRLAHPIRLSAKPKTVAS